MSQPKRKLPNLPPFDLKEAEEIILRVEDIAVLERDAGEASRYILGNLIFMLHKLQVIDAPNFLEWLKNGIQNIEEAGVRCSVEAMIEVWLFELNTKINEESGCTPDNQPH